MPSLPLLADEAPSTRLDPSCDHQMRVVGSLPVGAHHGLECDRPLLAVCRHCDGRQHWRCDSYGCGPCGETKRRRLQRLIADGASDHVAAGLRGYFVTLTAPGVNDHRRWYQGRRPATRPACSCHLHGLTDGEWNRQESACWNRLRTALTRTRSMAYAGSVETQGRGLLHRHVVLFVDESLTHSEVQEAAVAAGYGCVVDVEPLQDARKASRYLAKYVTKSSSERATVPWSRTEIDMDTGEITEVPVKATYRLWSSSRSWGVTMAQIRARASAEARARARYLAELLDAIGHQGDATTSLAPLALDQAPASVP